MGDFAAKRHPHHGRIFACQFSVAIGVPFSVLILKVCSPDATPLGHASGSASAELRASSRSSMCLCAGTACQWRC